MFFQVQITLPARRAPPAAIPRGLLDKYTGLYLWGKEKIPMHIRSDGEVLTLRWAESTSAVPLTPLGDNEFLDRSSFGRIRFDGSGLVWTQHGRNTLAPREQG
jgi:hypothetical protein